MALAKTGSPDLKVLEVASGSGDPACAGQLTVYEYCILTSFASPSVALA